MNTSRHSKLSSSRASFVIALCFLAYAATSAPATAATNPPPSASAPKSGTNATAQSDVKIPTSVFSIPTSVTEGRDPFFPNSTRNRVTVETNKVVKAPTVSLVLQGISGTEARRFALISGQTFIIGEEHDMNVGDSRINVRCLNITEDSAVVEVNGRQEVLRLRPGI